MTTDPGPVVVIGITGPSASGKTTLAAAITQHTPGAVHLQQDWYFRDPDEYPPDANFCQLRWLHLDEFVAAFDALAAGDRTQVPEIDFRTFRRCGTRALGPTRHLVVEGMTIFRIPKIYHRCHVRYYLDCDFATITRRKRDRDRRERDKPAAVIEAQLAWMRIAYQADQALRADPTIAVLGPADLNRMIQP